jgi:transposase-like protein
MFLKTQEECLTFLEHVYWKNGPICPYCKSSRATAYKNEHRYRCNNCFTSYSVTVGTLFHKTHVDLIKWFRAIQIILLSSEKVSIRNLSKELQVSKKTACRMRDCIDNAIQEDIALVKKLANVDLPKQ